MSDVQDTRDGVAIARDYYDSAEADDFYRQVWGGEDIHIGLYGETQDIRTASRLTVDSMIAKLGNLKGKRVLDLGSGYGGAARVMAKEHGAHVTCLNLALKENARNRQRNEEEGLTDRITVIDGSFDNMPLDDDSFDIAWSQDAILHAPDRLAVLREVERVLKPGGEFIFHDPMQADGLNDTSVLQPIYDRIHLADLASIGFYREALTDLGFEEIETEELTHQLGNHYARVREVMLEKQAEFRLPDSFADRMSKGLGLWVDGAASKTLSWAIMHYRKRG